MLQQMRGRGANGEVVNARVAERARNDEIRTDDMCFVEDRVADRDVDIVPVCHCRLDTVPVQTGSNFMSRVRKVGTSVPRMGHPDYRCLAAIPGKRNRGVQGTRRLALRASSDQDTGPDGFWLDRVGNDDDRTARFLDHLFLYADQMRIKLFGQQASGTCQSLDVGLGRQANEYCFVCQFRFLLIAYDPSAE